MTEKFYRLVVIMLASIGVVSLIGYIILVSLNPTNAPDTLLNITFTAVGALGGTLAKPEDK